MEQYYKSRMQELFNVVSNLMSSSNSKVAVPAQRVAIPANPISPVIEEPILDKSDCLNDP